MIMTIEKQEEFNDQIKTIFRGGRINKINWGGEGTGAFGWSVWTTEQKLEFAMELASAMNQAADILQKERNEMLSQLNIAKQATENAQKALEIQKAIVMTTLTEDNEIKNRYIEDIQRLTRENKALREEVTKLKSE